ncbi:HAD-IA family hydrolase [Roseococcus sp. SDR]|uniref:HAD family hydrolase n=1 Tax=Roseococcus sp. SDR TaxID=2835532 RepID=UPI001BCE0A76|nr:HAD-IA family hydrolase [Roseococcus sp. SDR]MBV1846510.1 HAD-IA family hydrolase [Roseococcus sp. SDR]
MILNKVIGAVLFDCDGVLADSETLSNRIVAEEITALGWVLDGHAAQREFLGLSLPDMLPIIEGRVGPVPEGWGLALSHRIAREMEIGVTAMPGARAALEAVAAAGLPMAVCSNSARAELGMKMRVLGFEGFFEGRVFSFQDVARPKPAPDLYLAAAQACGVAPAECLVVEDSATGVAAGLAAGCQVVSLVPDLGVPHLEDMARLAARLR